MFALTLFALVHSSPIAAISWHKDGSSVVASNRVSFSPFNHILTVTDVSVGDAGTYTCTATQMTNMDPIAKMVTADITVTGEGEGEGRGSEGV